MTTKMKIKCALAACLATLSSSCYWSKIQLIKGNDALNASGRTISLSEKRWFNGQWSPINSQGTIEFNENGSYTILKKNYDSSGKEIEDSIHHVSLDKLSNGFYVVQSGSVDPNSKSSFFTYGLAYIVKNEVFRWELGGKRIYRDLKSHKSINLFEDCYKLQYNKIPTKDEDSRYSFSWSLKADLLACSEFIKSNHIAPDDIWEIS